MPKPAAHGEVAEGAGGGWIRGTYSRDRNIYARKEDGTEKLLLQWMPRLGKFKATKDGIEYYRHNKQQFIINVPCIGYKWDADSGTFVMCTIGHVVGGDPVRTIVPVDDDRAMAPDLDQDPEEVKRTLLQRMEEYIRNLPVIPTDHGDKHKLYQESDLIWAWDDSTEMTFDEKVVRHIYANDTIDFETVLDRPLRGMPYIDEHMYRRMDLCLSLIHI